jgi:hypothetical protein
MRDELGFSPRLSTLQAIERVLADGALPRAAA